MIDRKRLPFGPAGHWLLRYFRHLLPKRFCLYWSESKRLELLDNIIITIAGADIVYASCPFFFASGTSRVGESDRERGACGKKLIKHFQLLFTFSNGNIIFASPVLKVVHCCFGWSFSFFKAPPPLRLRIPFPFNGAPGIKYTPVRLPVCVWRSVVVHFHPCCNMRLRTRAKQLHRHLQNSVRRSAAAHLWFYWVVKL